MAGEYLHLQVWALDPAISLEDVSTFMSFDYNKPIEYLDDARLIARNQLTVTDRLLLNRWIEFEDGRGFGIQQREIYGQQVRYLSVIAHHETQASRDDAVIEEVVVPRRRRITPYDEKVFFFEYFNRVYVIPVGTKSRIENVRKKLMGASREKSEDQRRWRKVQTSEISAYHFSSEFFYWLLSKENCAVTIEDVEVEIRDIRAVSQTGAERSDVKHDSEGDNLLIEAIPRTGLSINSRVSKIGTSLHHQSGIVSLIIFSDGSCFVDRYISSVNQADGSSIGFEFNLERGVLDLYFSLLPALKQAYNHDVDTHEWTTTHQAAARKKWALGVIEELSAENELTIEEFKQLEWFKR